MFFMQMVAWGFVLFGWAFFFMVIAFNLTLAKPEQSVELLTDALTGNWVYMLKISIIASAVMHGLINFNPDLIST